MASNVYQDLYARHAALSDHGYFHLLTPISVGDIGMCWEQTVERKGPRAHFGSSQSGRDDGEVGRITNSSRLGPSVLLARSNTHAPR